MLSDSQQSIANAPVFVFVFVFVFDNVTRARGDNDADVSDLRKAEKGGFTSRERLVYCEWCEASPYHLLSVGALPVLWARG